VAEAAQYRAAAAAVVAEAEAAVAVAAAAVAAAAAETKLRTGKPHHPAHPLSFNNNWYKRMSSKTCRLVHKVAISDYQLRQARVQQLGPPPPTGRVFIKFRISLLSENLWRKY
jgi:Tfp pilus assembly protein FimV